MNSTWGEGGKTVSATPCFSVHPGAGTRKQRDCFLSIFKNEKNEKVIQTTLLLRKDPPRILSSEDVGVDAYLVISVSEVDPKNWITIRCRRKGTGAMPRTGNRLERKHHSWCFWGHSSVVKNCTLRHDILLAEGGPKSLPSSTARGLLR
jgi:hypothetical protein